MKKQHLFLSFIFPAILMLTGCEATQPTIESEQPTAIVPAATDTKTIDAPA